MIKKSKWMTLCISLFIGAVITSCSKEDPEISHYELEGSWLLYHTYSNRSDSVYEKSLANQIIFSPKYLWLYSDSHKLDSGKYQLTHPLNADDHFSARLLLNEGPVQSLYLHGDTLKLSDSSPMDSVAIYIKAPQMQPYD